jgi:CheY-like chemotaxis protein
MNRRTVLVVDDDESLRRITQMQLEEAGYETFIAASGAVALQIMEERNPALVVTDLKMPGMSGIELLRRLRSQFPDTTVIMITAFGTSTPTSTTVVETRTDSSPLENAAITASFSLDFILPCSKPAE